MDTGSQHKMKYTKPDRRKMRDNLELIDTGKLLKQTPLAQTLRTSNKWDQMKHKGQHHLDKTATERAKKNHLY